MLDSWLVFIVSLPTHNASGRMRVWRALKGLGCGVLRDGVYLLPNRPAFRQTLALQAKQVVSGTGNAHILMLDSGDAEQQANFEKLFDRSDDYAKLIETIRETANTTRQQEDAAKLQKQFKQLRKAFEAIAEIDFFPRPAREQAAAALDDLEQTVNEHLAPDEPHAVQRRIKKLNRQDYANRAWATRQHLRIDRLASAWLIRNFIDPNPSFIWLASPDDCPTEALGFDFDGAAFTHVGAKVTFEVLQASFGLTQDKALNRIAAIVHYLDVGGISKPEAAGLETLIDGMRQRWNNDDELLAETEKIFDAFYQAFSGSDS